MALHTADEHAGLYGQLRAQILSRFFAFSRYCESPINSKPSWRGPSRSINYSPRRG